MGQLTQNQIAAYERDGYLAPIDAATADQASTWRSEIEGLEATHARGAGGHDLAQFFRVNGHLTVPLLSEIAKTPAIVDAVAQILGPDLLVWSVELFIKEAGSEKRVSWHQDITYWGMGDTNDELTAWLALSDVSVEAGCMRFIPGSHAAMAEHRDTFCDNNMLSRGQEIADVDEAQAIHGPLTPGQMSFHNGRTFHASGPNHSADRRIGCAIRYVTPEIRQASAGRDYAMPVRGADRIGGWIPVAAPTTLFDVDALRLYDEVLTHQTVALAAGATQEVGGYTEGQVQ